MMTAREGPRKVLADVAVPQVVHGGDGVDAMASHAADVVPLLFLLHSFSGSTDADLDSIPAVFG